MNTPEFRVLRRVTAASATAVTVTPSVDTMDTGGSGQVSTVTINGTGLKGFAVGDSLAVKITQA